MAFVDQQGVMSLVEALIRHTWPLQTALPPAFPRLSYRQAISLYGSDKPDTRIPWTIQART